MPAHRLILPALLFGSHALALVQAAALTPASASARGEATLLSKEVGPGWISYSGPSVLGFFMKGQKNLGLKGLAQEYKGRLAVGGVHPAHKAMHKHFGVTAAEMPVYLVVQGGKASMRLSGGSNLGTLKMLLQSVVSQYQQQQQQQPPPPPPMPTAVTIPTLRERCLASKGPCVVVATSKRLRRKAMAIVARVMRGIEKKPSKAALWADINDAAIASTLGHDGKGSVMVRVLKGASRPRIAHFESELTAQHGAEAFAAFVDNLRSGLLTFARFEWPKVEEGSPTLPPPPPRERVRKAETEPEMSRGDGKRATWPHQGGQKETEEIELDDDE